MAFNYSNLKFLISRACKAGEEEKHWQLLMITSTFSSFFLLASLLLLLSALSLLQPSPATEKAIHLSLEAFFSFHSSRRIHFPESGRGNEKWSDIYQQKLKLTYWWRLIKRTYFSKSCIINESLSRRGVHYCRMISLIKHFTVYRSDLEWIIDFALHVISANFSFRVNLCLCQLIARHTRSRWLCQ